MDLDLTARLERLLSEQVTALTSQFTALPVDLRVIRAALGLGIEVRSAPTQHGELLRADEGAGTIVVYHPSRSELNVHRARFTVAHEIGHFLVDARGGYQPISRSDYWALETLCDRFAGSLLLPAHLLKLSLRPTGKLDPKSLLGDLKSISNDGQTSPEAAARRIVEVLSRNGKLVEFAQIRQWNPKGRRVDKRRPAPIAEVDWATGGLLDIGRRTRIRQGDPLTDALTAAIREMNRPAALAERVVLRQSPRWSLALRAEGARTLWLCAVGESVEASTLQ